MRKLIFFIITAISVLIIGNLVIHQKKVLTVTPPARRGMVLQMGSDTFNTQYRKNVDALIEIVNKQDPKIALSELQHRMDTDKFVFKNCHVMAHSIGLAAYKKYKDFNIALQYQNLTCSNGYIHGVIEAKFSSLKSDQAAINELKTVCSKYISADRCWHGTGHGLMFFASNDLPRALSICNTYSTVRAQHRCYEGVFMENFLEDPDAGHPSVYVDASNPFKTCIGQAGKYKAVCYFYVPIYYLNLHNNDYVSAIKWCKGAEMGYTNSCTRGVGSLAMKYNIDTPKYVEGVCMKSNTNDIQSCIEGMISYYLTFTSSLSKTASLCTNLEASNVKSCETAVRRNVGLFQD